MNTQDISYVNIVECNMLWCDTLLVEYKLQYPHMISYVGQFFRYIEKLWFTQLWVWKNLDTYNNFKIIRLWNVHCLSTDILCQLCSSIL